MRGAFQRHVPDAGQLVAVFAAIAALVYSWSILTSFYMLPSWLFFLSAGQLAAVYSYTFLAALAASLLLFVLVVLAEVILLRSVLGASRFVARSFLISIGLLVSVILRLNLLKHVPAGAAFVQGEPSWWVLTLIVIGMLVFAVQRSGRLSGLLDDVARRATIFLAIYVPLTLVSAIVVAWRLLT